MHILIELDSGSFKIVDRCEKQFPTTDKLVWREEPVGVEYAVGGSYDIEKSVYTPPPAPPKRVYSAQEIEYRAIRNRIAPTQAELDAAKAELESETP